MSKISYGIYAIVVCLALSCSEFSDKPATMQNTDQAEQLVGATLDSLNATAARADYSAYFDLYASDAVFTGTDAMERWNKQEFMAWAKPIFDKGRAWDFTAIERHIYFDSTNSIAWFDELLNTQMKICRGSGVLVKQEDAWKIQQYILSTTVPNDILDSVIAIKAPLEDSIIKQLTNK